MGGVESRKSGKRTNEPKTPFPVYFQRANVALTHVVEQTGRLFGFEMQHESVALGVAVERVLEKFLAGERRLGRYFVCGKTKTNTNIKRVFYYCRRPREK